MNEIKFHQTQSTLKTSVNDDAASSIQTIESFILHLFNRLHYKIKSLRKKTKNIIIKSLHFLYHSIQKVIYHLSQPHVSHYGIDFRFEFPFSNIFDSVPPDFIMGTFDLI